MTPVTNDDNDDDDDDNDDDVDDNDDDGTTQWQLLSAFLGYQDYMATGQPDLTLAFTQEMYDRTFIGFLDSSNGLLRTDKVRLLDASD
jgi:hypothetical protein